MVLNYIEVSTPHTYWLARSFVLLADVYMKLGRNLDAIHGQQEVPETENSLWK